MTFARFMELALYHPELGYYATGRRGPGRSVGLPHRARVPPDLRLGDGPPARGGLGPPRAAGAVHGSRARCRHRRARGRRSSRASPVPARRSGPPSAIGSPNGRPSGSARSRERLAAARRRPTSWRPTTATAIVGAVLANEVLDALPVHRVQGAKTGSSWSSSSDSTPTGELARSPGRPSTPALGGSPGRGGDPPRPRPACRGLPRRWTTGSPARRRASSAGCCSSWTTAIPRPRSTNPPAAACCAPTSATASTTTRSRTSAARTSRPTWT